MSDPTLSIVVAVWRRADALEACLRTLAEQVHQAGAGVEVLIVSTLGANGLGAGDPRFRWLTAPPGWLVPRLWGMGMAAARHEIVAITTAQFVPEPDWVARIRRNFAQSPAIGIGGPIEPPRGRGWRGIVDWAIYFQRYSTYLGWDQPRATTDLPGDNAAYRRSALLRHPQFFDEGFWEPEFHRRILDEGGALAWRPDVRVRQGGGFGMWRFMRQRFCHAMRFGRSRAAGRGLGFRLAAAGLSPLIPLIFGGKIVARVFRARKDIGPFVIASPLLALFLIVWALGEACGYLRPAPRREPSLFERKGVSV